MLLHVVKRNRAGGSISFNNRWSPKAAFSTSIVIRRLNMLLHVAYTQGRFFILKAILARFPHSPIQGIFTSEVKSFYSDPARGNDEFLLKWNFSLTKRCTKTQKWNKRIDCSPKRRVFIWICWLNHLCWFAVLLFFLKCWHVICLKLNNIANCRAIFWTQFYGPCSVFPLEFYFLISSHFTSFKKIWFLD